MWSEPWGRLCDNKLSSRALFDVIYGVAPHRFNGRRKFLPRPLQERPTTAPGLGLEPMACWWNGGAIAKSSLFMAFGDLCKILCPTTENSVAFLQKKHKDFSRTGRMWIQDRLSLPYTNDIMQIEAIWYVIYDSGTFNSLTKKINILYIHSLGDEGVGSEFKHHSTFIDRDGVKNHMWIRVTRRFSFTF